VIKLRKVLDRPIGELTREGINGAHASRSVREQVAELGGTRAAARQIGRSERTIRRWAQNNTVPTRGGAKQSFDQAVADRRGSADYRRAQLNPRREKRMRNNGARLQFSGMAGPLNDSTDDSFKRRNIDVHISAAAMSDILDAYLVDGDQAAVDALGQALAEEYMYTENYGWQFAPQVKAVDFLRHNSW